MTSFCLVRHGTTATLGQRLTGRRPDVPLDAKARDELEALASYLASEPLRAVYSSPLTRTLTTATAIARPHGLGVVRLESLADIELGDWSDRSLDALRSDPTFHAFNVHRAGTAPPGGEHPAAVQCRMAVELCRLRDAHRDETIAVVGHADPLRSVLAFFVGIPLDLAHRIEIEPASVTRLELGAEHASLRLLNFVPASMRRRADGV